MTSSTRTGRRPKRLLAALALLGVATAAALGTAAPHAQADGPTVVSGSITIVPNTHVHPNWVFTKPGAYTLTISQTATGKDGQKLRGLSTLNFNVGSSDGITSGHFDFGPHIKDGKLVPMLKDDRTSPPQWVDPASVTFALGDAAKATVPTAIDGIPGKTAVWMIGSSQIPTVPWVGANTQHESLINNTTGPVTFTLESASGPGDVRVFTSGNFGQIVGETWFSVQHTTPKSDSTAKPSSGKTDAENTQDTGIQDTGTQDKDTQDTGTKTPTPTPTPKPTKPTTPAGPADIDPCIAVDASRPATAAEIKAATTGSTTTSGAGVSGSIQIAPNAHVHPNWVFTKPGSYALTIRETVKGKDGTQHSATSTLRFNVSSSAGITSGHFDFGPQFANGKLIPTIKDDRSAPATWVDPSSVSFALGNAAKATAPAGLDWFVPAGTTVWMSASAQVPGVPWVGANTMHESLITNTTGPVTFTLVSATGPGNVGVFTSGNFGQIVGEKWFTYTAGKATTTKAQLPSESEAREGQVFMKDGKYFVKHTVGTRERSGESCVLAKPTGMPKTGV